MVTKMKFRDKLRLLAGKGMNERISIKGVIHGVLRDEFGNIKEEKSFKNTTKNPALYALVDQMLATPGYVGYTAKPGWMAVGTGSPAATLLGAEIARVALNSPKTVSGAVLTMVGVFGAGTGTGTLTEAGVFDVVTANTAYMHCCGTIAFTKGASDSLTLTWTWTIS